MARKLIKRVYTLPSLEQPEIVIRRPIFQNKRIYEGRNNEYIKEKEYFELFSKNIIYKIVGEDVSKYEKGECPDWQDYTNSIGLEVTRTAEGTNFWGELRNVKKPIPDGKVEIFNKRFEKNGGRIITKEKARIIFQNPNFKCSFGFNDKYIYLLPVYSDNFDNINKAIIDKLNKLNQHYNKELKVNKLFIFSPIYIVDNMIDKEIIEIAQIQEKYKNKFDSIYICILYGLYSLNLDDMTWKYIEIGKELLDKISTESYKNITKQKQ